MEQNKKLQVATGVTGCCKPVDYVHKQGESSSECTTDVICAC